MSLSRFRVFCDNIIQGFGVFFFGSNVSLSTYSTRAMVGNTSVVTFLI